MKKMEYKTPVLEVRAYAQFENVFTACTRDEDPCVKAGSTYPGLLGQHAGLSGS